MDPEFEFNAPRFFDFQRFEEESSPPSSEGDTYFDTSKVKELRTPERSSGDENNEDTAQLLKDIQKVREELQQEEEATSNMHPSIAGAKSPLALPAQQGGAQAGHGVPLAEVAGPSVMEREQQEKIVVSGTVRAVGLTRVRPEEAEQDLAGHSISAQARVDGQPSTGQDAARAGSADMAEGPAAATAAAQQPRHKRKHVPQEGSSAGSMGGLGGRRLSPATQPQQEASAAETDVAASPVKRAGTSAAVSGAAAAPGASVLAQVSQNPAGPQPFPMHPARVLAANSAMKETELRTAERAAVSKRPALANLVTSWGPRSVPQAPAQTASSGLVAPGTASLVHSAGKSQKLPMASREEAPKLIASGTGASGRTARKASTTAEGVSQQGSKRLDRHAEASAVRLKSGKRPAETDQQGGPDAGVKATSKRPRLGASPHKGAAPSAGAARAGVQVSGSSRAEATKQAKPRAGHAQPVKGPGPRGKPVQQAKAAQKSLVVPRSPKLGRPRDCARQGKEPEKAARPQQNLRQPSEKVGAGKRQLTKAKTPQLRTSKRRRTAAGPALQPAQDQEEWKPLALMVAEFEASTPARFNHGPRAVQYVPPPQPDPDARAAAPDLATDARLRPSRFKPHEEQELEDMASRPAFHALPINAAVMSSRGDLGVHPVPARPVTMSQTPKLATKARAVAHPAFQQGIKPAAKQGAPFDPHKLTVPQSPAFATRSRLRAQGVQPVEPAEPSFLFKAQKAPDQGAGQVATRPRQSRRRQTSSFKPFQLSTDARARTHHSTSSQVEPAKAPAFHAAPVPRTLYRPAQLPAVPEAKPTEQQAFQLLSKARHQQAVAEQEAKLRAQQVRDRRKSSFRAAPPPRFPQPPAPARSERPATRALTPKLAVETRSTARAAFDAMVAENKRKEEEKRIAEVAEQAAEQAKELKEYRSQLNFKARPMPQSAAGPQRTYVLPGAKMTVPVSPQLQTSSRARLPG
ncbi:g2566 [Coccomyxa viridis]|uniref:G2566 protein n=1 Tax=Coccomyxa viridis TaxID=1274662 RepID=A0ABP1FSM2_9CHLO